MWIMNKMFLVQSIILLIIYSCKEKEEYFNLSSKEIIEYKGKSAFEIIEYAKLQEFKQNIHLVSTVLAKSLMEKDTVILINKDYQAEVKIHELVFFANKPIETDSLTIPVTKRIKEKMKICKIYYGVITSADE